MMTTIEGYGGYFTEHTVMNPNVEQRRCATQVLKREKVEGGVAWTFLFTHDVWRSVQPWVEESL